MGVLSAEYRKVCACFVVGVCCDASSGAFDAVDGAIDASSAAVADGAESPSDCVELLVLGIALPGCLFFCSFFGLGLSESD